MFRREQIDFLICFMSTYALSSTVLPVVQRAGVPLLIASLQPTKAMDYEHGTTFMQLEHDNQTSLPEVCCALRRANIEVAGMVVGTLYDDEVAWQRILDWCKVARAVAAVRNARIGVMGHVYEGMLDMNSDPTMFDAALRHALRAHRAGRPGRVRRGGDGRGGGAQARGDPRALRLPGARQRPHRRPGQAGGPRLVGHGPPAGWIG